MLRHHLTWITTSVCAAAIALSGCNRKSDAPELQTTTGVQAKAEPITVTGCLKRGVIAEDTFVLLASQAPGASAAITYEVVGRPE